jgi:hypothetical protein
VLCCDPALAHTLIALHDNYRMSRSTTFSELATGGLESFSQHGGEVGARLGRLDWSLTALGKPDTWSPTLQALLGTCLESPVPMAICWGRDLTFLHNDAFRPILGGKWPMCLGRPAREVFAESWHLLKDYFLRAMTAGKATRWNDQYVPMIRRDYTHDGSYTYGFSPIRGGQDRIAGTLVIATSALSHNPDRKYVLPM